MGKKVVENSWNGRLSDVRLWYRYHPAAAAQRPWFNFGLKLSVHLPGQPCTLPDEFMDVAKTRHSCVV